jgi:hypothetical protein
VRARVNIGTDPVTAVTGAFGVLKAALVPEKSGHADDR